MTGCAGLGQDKIYVKQHCSRIGSSGAVAMALRAARSRIKIRDNTHSHTPTHSLTSTHTHTHIHTHSQHTRTHTHTHARTHTHLSTALQSRYLGYGRQCGDKHGMAFVRFHTSVGMSLKER